MYLDHEPEITVKLDSSVGSVFVNLVSLEKLKLDDESICFLFARTDQKVLSTGHLQWKTVRKHHELRQERLLNILLVDKLNQELVIKIQQQYNLVRGARRRAVCLDKFPSEKPTHDIFFETEEGTNKIIKIKD